VSKQESQDLISGIKNRDNVTLKKIYKKHFSLIESFVTSNKGTVDDAKDVFQEAIIVIYRYTRDKDFEISCSFETFLYSICRTIWLNYLRNKRIHDDKVEESAEYRLYQKHFQKLGNECKKLMQLFYDKVPYKEIARQMGYSSIAMVKKKKFMCKEFLLKSIRNDPEFKDL
jgi:RNA polymerase sigma factor (sigma-70 family)